MSENGEKELVLKNGNNLPYGTFPEAVVQRALLHCMEAQSVAQGHKRLKAELGAWGKAPCPSYEIVWLWVKQSEECFAAVTTDRKREMVALASDAASAATGRLLEALPGLSGSQMPVAYGIAMQRRTDWEKAGQPNPMTAIQINLMGSDGEKIEQV